jgi:predicted dehydrogenase
MRECKWGILAPGNIANAFANGLKTVPNAVLTAVGSRDLDKARDFSDKHGFEKAYGSYKELAADPDVEVIYISTPHNGHEEAALMCLDQGKAVLCEKPFAVNATQTANMINRARANNVFLMEAMWSRFMPSNRKVCKLITDGAIGKVRYITADFGFRADLNPQNRLFRPELAGGSLLDVGIYNLSFCSMIYGKQPKRVQSNFAIGSTGVDEEAALLLDYDEGQSASLFSAIRLNTPQTAAIYGETGSIKLPVYWHTDTVILSNNDGEQEIKTQAPGFEYEIIEVMECLEKGDKESSILPLSETLEIMQTMDKIRADNNFKYPFE